MGRKRSTASASSPARPGKSPLCRFSFAGFALLLALLRVLLPLVPARASQPCAVPALLLPLLTYVLLSRVWLVGTMLQELFRAPAVVTRSRPSTEADGRARGTVERYIHLNAIPSDGQGNMAVGLSHGGDTYPEHPTVLIADDTLPLRRGVRESLEADGFVVVAEAADAAAAIAAATRLRPDILLIEPELPGEGLHAIGRIAKASPKTLIIVLSRVGPGGGRRHCVHARRLRLPPQGVERRASRVHPPMALFTASRPLSRSLVPYLVDEIRRGSVRRLALPGGSVTLTSREWEVGELLLRRVARPRRSRKASVSHR